jgi:hypothetical protein
MAWVSENLITFYEGEEGKLMIFFFWNIIVFELKCLRPDFIFFVVFQKDFCCRMQVFACFYFEKSRRKGGGDYQLRATK